MDRLRALRVIADTNLGLTLTESLRLADALHAEFSKPAKPKYDFENFYDRVAFAKTLPGVMDNLPDRKIQAIKNLRTTLQDTPGGSVASGLKECKDVIEHLAPYRY